MGEVSTYMIILINSYKFEKGSPILSIEGDLHRQSLQGGRHGPWYRFLKWLVLFYDVLRILSLERQGSITVMVG